MGDPVQKQSFLWMVVESGLLNDDRDRAVQDVASFYEAGEEIDSVFDVPLTQFLNSGSREDLLGLALICTKNFVFDLTSQIKLISYLYQQGVLDIKSALMYIDLNGVAVDDLPSAVRVVAELAWFLKEDQEFKETMNFDNTQFIDALRAVYP